MSRFVQIHLLTFYPPANLNRDDTGRPKTAQVGGVERLRISSQAIKRAVRTSEIFADKLAGHLGKRTQRLGETLERMLVDEYQLGSEEARPLAKVLSSLFGKPETDPKKELFIKQLAFVAPSEIGKLRAIMERCKKDADYRSKLTNAAAEIALEESNDSDDEPRGSSKKPKQ